LTFVIINTGKEGKNHLLPGCQHDYRDKNQILLDGRFWNQQQSLKGNLKQENERNDSEMASLCRRV